MIFLNSDLPVIAFVTTAAIAVASLSRAPWVVSRALRAIQRKDHNIPIVFAALSGPVGAGIVKSLARRGGNATGFTIFEGSPVAKELEVLKEIAPGVARVALIHNPELPTWNANWRSLESAASSFAICRKWA